jgi:hypothetical protein
LYEAAQNFELFSNIQDQKKNQKLKKVLVNFLFVQNNIPPFAKLYSTGKFNQTSMG